MQRIESGKMICADGEVETAGDSIVQYDLWMQSGQPADWRESDDAFDMTLPSGDFEVRITADPESNGKDGPFEGAEVKVKFTFSDESHVEVKFKP